MKGLFFFGLLISPAVFFAQTARDTLRETTIDGVDFTKRLPVSKEIIQVKKDLDHKNLGQDLPILLKNQTSVVSTSDAGNGVGYTSFRIRGVAGNSINVMMNGVPYNDAESQGTFFVDVPDLASSASQIVIQRGVGTSSNGVSAFGASVNILTKDPSDRFYMQSDNSYGSFDTYKYSLEIGSGKILNNMISLFGRYTKIHSDGYVDRASSDLDSYNFSGVFEKNSTKIKFTAFGGKEKTYQAWNGISKKDWEKNPTINYSGAIYDENWENIVGYYDNETDNYRQNHYHLLWEQRISDLWKLENTLHYTKGKGYYENYKQGDPFSRYNLPAFNGENYGDFIRKKWLDNDFYGIVSNVYGQISNLKLNLGAVANQYYGKHFGNVSGVFIPQISEHEYYRNKSVKNEISGFAKGIVNFGKFEVFADAQVRNITYETQILLQGDDEGVDLSKNWSFFNPKAGLNYLLNEGKLYLSYAKASREPNRDDLFANPETKPETLHDWELGLEKNFGKNLKLAANLYHMSYINQLVLTGEINNVGAFIRANSGKSYRTGAEVSAEATMTGWMKAMANFTYSVNRNRDYKISENGRLSSLGNTPISFSPNFISNLGLVFTPAEYFSFGIQNQFVSKQYLDNTGSENLALPAYYLADFHAKYTLDLQRTAVDFKLLINNIFNRKYVNNGYVYDNDPYYFAQAGTNFMFGVSFRFQ